MVTRVWSAGAEFPVHLNSDLELHEDKLCVAAGGSHTVFEVDLNDFATTRVVTVTPGVLTRWFSGRQRRRNVVGGLMRKSPSPGLHLILQTYMVTGWRTFDGVYAARVSPDGRYVAAGSRGYNYLRVMDRQTLRTIYDRNLPKRDGLHLGLHHSEMVAGEPS